MEILSIIFCLVFEMKLRYLIILAVSLVSCQADCVPDKFLFTNENSISVGSKTSINVSSDSVIKLIPFLNEYKYNTSGQNDNLLMVTCKIKK